MTELEQTINERRSVRMFLPDRTVPLQLVEEALEIASRAPSSSNIQPWRMVVVSGAARERLVAAMLEDVAANPPQMPPIPDEFAYLRAQTGDQLYGAMGIDRADTQSRYAAMLRNWEFFKAPMAGVVCIHQDLHPADILGVGMFLQTLMLALTARGGGGHLCAGRNRHVSGCRTCRTRHCPRADDSVRLGDWLPRPRLPRQPHPHSPQPGVRQRRVHRRVNR